MPRQNVSTQFFTSIERILRFTVWPCRKTGSHPEGAYLPELRLRFAENPDPAWVREMKVRGHRVLAYEVNNTHIEVYDEDDLEVASFRQPFDLKAIRQFLEEQAS